MFEIQKESVKVAHHNRQVYGVLTTPQKEGVYPIVIFSHGYNGSGRDFERMSEFLAVNGVAAYCYDFCGGSVHSRSSMATTDMTIFTEKEDLHSVLHYFMGSKKVDREQMYVFGGSQGGLVSALVTEERKEDIRGLFLLFPALCIADNWNERFQNASDIPDEQELWGMKLGRKFFETLQGFDVFEHIGKYTGDVLVMHGDMDPIVPLGYSERLKSVYKNVDVKVFSGEGHGFSEEGNKRVAEMVLEVVKNGGGR